MHPTRSWRFSPLPAFLAALLLLTSVTCTACAPFGASGPPSDKPTLRLATSPSMLAAAVFIADRQGYFSQRGLNVQLIDYVSGRDALNAVLNGDADVATVSSLPLTVATFQRDDFAILATFAYTYGNDRLVARRGAEMSLADLRGKRVGFQAGTNSEYALDTLLLYGGMTFGDIQAVSLPASDLPGALQAGQLDAIMVWEPIAYEAKEALGSDGGYIPLSGSVLTTFNLACSKAYADAHETELENMLRAVEQANRCIERHRRASQVAIAGWIDIPPETVAAIWDSYQRDVSLDQSLIITMEGEARWALDRGIVQGPVPDVLNTIDFDVLQAVQPEADTIVH